MGVLLLGNIASHAVLELANGMTSEASALCTTLSKSRSRMAAMGAAASSASPIPFSNVEP